ncbi:MAG: hypothetical protein JNN08_02185 [Bryobacterales bacterium]|nr:hypothetical protein [Bryobacterales bacterium]
MSCRSPRLLLCGGTPLRVLKPGDKVDVSKHGKRDVWVRPVGKKAEKLKLPDPGPCACAAA